MWFWRFMFCYYELYEVSFVLCVFLSSALEAPHSFFCGLYRILLFACVVSCVGALRYIIFLRSTCASGSSVYSGLCVMHCVLMYTIELLFHGCEFFVTLWDCALVLFFFSFSHC